MHLIDRHAYTNALRRVDPAQKGGLAALAIVLCLLLDRPAVGLLTLAWMLALTTLWARVPLLVFGRALLSEGLFLALSVVGVAVSVSLTPAGPAAAWRLGPLWLSAGPQGLSLALRLLTRALGCAAALNFLILTTPLTDMITLLQRLRVPAALIELMTIIYRAIFVLLESLQRMATAQDARLGYSGPRRMLRSAGLLGSRLFLDAYLRSRRMQVALESRGLDGPLRVLPLDYTRDRRVWWLGAAFTVSLLLVGVVL
ncbi:MAG: cobalt ECF transporter T component CbiQ [Chloroflexales bacterium]|nr:cobalt ECF transporter T component CbiQ [Chloroflexales bacterium]